MSSAEITSQGKHNQLKLHDRNCAVCSRPYRVLTTSPQTTCGSFCEQQISPVAKAKAIKANKSAAFHTPGSKSRKAPWESFNDDQEKHGEGVLDFEYTIPDRSTARTKPVIAGVREDGTVELVAENVTSLKPVAKKPEIHHVPTKVLPEKSQVFTSVDTREIAHLEDQTDKNGNFSASFGQEFVNQKLLTGSNEIAEIGNKNEVTIRSQVETAKKVAENPQLFPKKEITGQLLKTTNVSSSVKKTEPVKQALTVHGNVRRNRGADLKFKHSSKILTSAGVEQKKLPDFNTKERDELEKKWQFYVDQGQQLIDKMGEDRLKVAELAIAACDIHHGGGAHWNNFEGVYTLTRYAKEVGISYKTLHGWVRVKTNVYDKLQIAGAKVDVISQWRIMNRVVDRCTKEDTPEQVLEKFKKWDIKEDFNHQRYLMMTLRKMRSFANYLEMKKPSKKHFDKGDLDELLHHAKVIGKWAKE